MANVDGRGQDDCGKKTPIDKLAGDQVSGYYVPGLAGPKHAGVAVQSAQALLRATGHGDPNGPWIPVSIDVHTGEAFIGAVGTQGGITDITALGDAVNIAARLASNARPGEILVSQETYSNAGFDLRHFEQGAHLERSLQIGFRVRSLKS